MDPSAQRMMSTLEVWRRIKVLTPEGAEEYGEVEILHSRQLRLANFKGRTLLPDGREMEVGSDAVFERTESRTERKFVTAVAFPNVEPGAILDYSYDLHFDSIFHLEPWYFQARVPVLRSEIVYHIPDSLVVGAWGKALPGKEIHQEVQSEKGARRLHVWMENLPALADEPASVPDEDLSAKFMLVPKRLEYLGSIQPLMESWRDVCRLVEEQIYENVGRKAKAVRRKAQELTAGLKDASSRERARALYTFVRDEIDTLSSWSVFPRDKVGLDDVLEEGRGTSPEKALLLQALLRAVDLDAQVVWAPNRWDGVIDVSVPNPYWFEKVLVRAHLPFGGGAHQRRLGRGPDRRSPVGAVVGAGVPGAARPGPRPTLLPEPGGYPDDPEPGGPGVPGRGDEGRERDRRGLGLRSGPQPGSQPAVGAGLRGGRGALAIGAAGGPVPAPGEGVGDRQRGGPLRPDGGRGGRRPGGDPAAGAAPPLVGAGANGGGAGAGPGRDPGPQTAGAVRGVRGGRDALRWAWEPGRAPGAA